MSDQNKMRIKGLRKYASKDLNNQPFSPSQMIPFGTNGQLVDMASDLDLEQELKIGGNKSSKIIIKTEDEVISTPDGEKIVSSIITYIIEKYRSRYSEQSYTYSKITKIHEIPEAQLLQADTVNSIIGYEDENELPSTIIGNFTSNIETTVTIYLYKGDFEETFEEDYDSNTNKFLWKKTVEITQDQIQEQVFQSLTNEEEEQISTIHFNNE